MQLHLQYTFRHFIAICSIVPRCIEGASTGIRHDYDDGKDEIEFHPGPLFPNTSDEVSFMDIGGTICSCTFNTRSNTSSLYASSYQDALKVLVQVFVMITTMERTKLSSILDHFSQIIFTDFDLMFDFCWVSYFADIL